MRRRTWAWLPAVVVIALFAGGGHAAPPEAEPPRLLLILREDYRPAYQFYLTPPGGRAADLRGRRQRVRGSAPLDGDRTLIETTAGADVVLTALTDRPLTAARVLPAVAGAADVKAEVTADGGTKGGLVRVRLNNVRGTVPLVLEFTAAGGAVGRRSVTVRAVEDQAPAADCAVEVVRKIPQGYVVTPSALVPFAATVRDDHGLDRVAYVVTAARLGADGQVGREGPEQAVPVGGFTQLLRQREGRGMPVRDFHVTADDTSSALDLGKLPHLFRESDPHAPPARYRLRVRLEATDNDVETGPHTARTEPVTFVIVSELELLAEVGLEDERLLQTLEGRVARRLPEVQLRLRTLNERLAAARPEEVGELAGRADELAEAVERAAEAVRDVHAGYRAVVAELRANRVRADVTDRVEKAVCGPLDEVLRRDFVRTAEAVGELCKRLDGDEAGQARKAGTAAVGQMDALVGRVHAVAAAARELDRANGEIRERLEVQRAIERLLRDRQ